MKIPFFLLVAAMFAFSCTQTVDRVDNRPGPATMYHDSREHRPISRGDVGIGTDNIAEVCDIMVRDMLANPMITGRAVPARVIIDSQYFTNQSSNIINKDLIIDRLRIELMRASRGRIHFVGREFSGMVEQERTLKRDGYVQPGTMAASPAQMGGDYRLTGRISSYDAIDPRSGARTRYTQITFNMVDLENAMIVWSNLYDFKKFGSGALPVYR